MEEIMNSQEQTNEVIELTPTLKQDFIASAKWGKFFAVINYISAGLMLLFCITTLLMPTDLSSMGDDFEDLNVPSSLMIVSKGFSIVIFLFGIVVCFGLAYLLMKASKNVLNGINEQNQDKIAVGIHNLKTYCQISGVITVIVCFIAVVSLLGTIFIGMSIAM